MTQELLDSPNPNSPAQSDAYVIFTQVGDHQHGGMVAWRHGAWQHDSMAVWQHGGMTAWRYGIGIGSMTLSKAW